MKIQINEKNRHKINVVLSETAGNAYAHTISVYYELEELVQRAEQKLDASGLLVKDRRSARLTFLPPDPARHTPRSRATSRPPGSSLSVAPTAGS